MSVQFAPAPHPLSAIAAHAAGSFAKPAGDHTPFRPSGLLPAGPVLEFSPDEQIFGQGEEALIFFRVVTGTVRTCKFMNDGRRQIQAFHVAGELIGFEAGDEYSLTAEAVSDCTLVPYRRNALDAQLATNEALSQQLFAHAMRSLKQAREHAVMLGRRTAAEKVAAFIIECAGRSSDGRVANLAMTRQDIADYLGLTIETVSRTLSQLERDAVIELPALRQIRLKNPAALRSLNS
jgi:CRP/FNR family nitrogen fixation transcriptional regulator